MSLALQKQLFSIVSRNRLFSTSKTTWNSENDGPTEMLTSSFVLEDYPGIASAPFDGEVQQKLHKSLEPAQIEIKPDGLLYLPQDQYRRLMTDTFGSGGWALVPRSELTIKDDFALREYALFAQGRFVAQAVGEHRTAMGLGAAAESTKSNALMRCCKDLGIASELWSTSWTNEWKEKYAEQEWVEHMRTKERKKLWKKKGTAWSYPWKPTDGTSSSSSSYSAPSSSSSSPPPSSPSSSRFIDSSSSPDGAAQSSSEGGGATFDINGVVPPMLKKFAGEKWVDVLADPKGRSYLEWCSQTLSPPAGAISLQALTYWEEANEEDYDGI